MADTEQAGFSSQLTSRKVCAEETERVKGLPLTLKPDYLT